MYAFGEPPSGNMPFLNSSGASRVWRLMVLLGGDVRRADAYGVRMNRTVAMQRVDQAPWQRLVPLAGDPGTEPGRVQRVFTFEGPQPEARRVTLRTQRAELPELTAYVEQDAVYLKRPQDPSLRGTFDDLVLKEEFTGAYLKKVADKAREAPRGANLTFDPAQSPATRHGSRAAHLAAEGDFQGAVAEMRQAAAEGTLAKAVAGYERRLQASLADPLRGRQVSDAAVAFARGAGSTPDPNLDLLVSLHELYGSHPSKAAEAIQAAVAHGDPQTLRAAIRSFDQAGFDAARDYVAARSGQVQGMSAELAQRIRLAPFTFRLHTRLEIGALGKPEPIPAHARVDLAARFLGERPADVYVEDSELLNKFDWDGAPGPSLARAARDPDLRWVIYDANNLGGFRPDLLYGEHKRLIRREVSTQPAPRGQLEPVVRSASASNSRMLAITSCDDDDDGRVTNEERVRCNAESRPADGSS